MTIILLRAIRATIALVLAAPLATPAMAQTGGFTRISEAGESRIDGLRDGTHEDVPVRFLDMTVRNTSGDITFPDTIQKVWWQGRNDGELAEPLHRRGLRQRGMYENMRPGSVWEVTYVIPRREDVLGVIIVDPAERSTAKQRLRTWEELRGGAPGAVAAEPARRAAPVTAPSKTRAAPAAARAAGSAPSAVGMVAQAQAAVAKLPTPVREELAPASSRLTDAIKRKLPRLNLFR
jgi:hypothetical protein